MLSVFPRNVFDEIWDLIESVSEGFPTYSYRAVGSLNTKMIAFSLRTFCFCFSSLLISVHGETYKTAI